MSIYSLCYISDSNIYLQKSILITVIVKLNQKTII